MADQYVVHHTAKSAYEEMEGKDYSQKNTESSNVAAIEATLTTLPEHKLQLTLRLPSSTNNIYLRWQPLSPACTITTLCKTNYLTDSTTSYKHNYSF